MNLGKILLENRAPLHMSNVHAMVVGFTLLENLTILQTFQFSLRFYENLLDKGFDRDSKTVGRPLWDSLGSMHSTSAV